MDGSGISLTFEQNLWCMHNQTQNLWRLWTWKTESGNSRKHSHLRLDEAFPGARTWHLFDVLLSPTRLTDRTKIVYSRPASKSSKSMLNEPVSNCKKKIYSKSRIRTRDLSHMATLPALRGQRRQPLSQIPFYKIEGLMTRVVRSVPQYPGEIPWWITPQLKYFRTYSSTWAAYWTFSHESMVKY
jgi:hypothetical protein